MFSIGPQETLLLTALVRDFLNKRKRDMAISPEETERVAIATQVMYVENILEVLTLENDKPVDTSPQHNPLDDWDINATAE
jgi:hypothetical protein